MPTTTYSQGPRWGLTLGLTLAAAAVVLLSGDRSTGPGTSGGEGPAATALAAADPGTLRYQVVTRFGTDPASCRAATPRTTQGVIGAPTVVEVGNGSLPDFAVELGAVPGGSGNTTVDLDVDRLSTGVLRARVEVVVTPATDDPGRIAFGYDGCESGAPDVFDETITTSPSRLTLSTATVRQLPALTILGSQFTRAADGSRSTFRDVSARLAPMPLTAHAAVTETAPESYDARVRVAPGTNVRLQQNQQDADGDTSTVAAEIGRFPGALDVSFTPTLIEYVAARPLGQPLTEPIDLVDITSVTAGPGDPEKRLHARLESVPPRGTLERTSPTRVEIDTPQGVIGAATVDYYSVPEGMTAPTLVPQGEQYLVARKVHDLLAAQVRVRGLSHAVVDAGDPLAGPDPENEGQTDLIPTVVEATHLAGPFTIDAAVTSTVSPTNPAEVTRTAVARVVDLPATARVEFGAGTQSFGYAGSAEIGSLTADVTSTRPFVDDATAAHLTVEDFPTGLVGRFDEDGKRFTARVPSGEIGLIELQATSGADVRLPDGIDGLRLEDHDGSYAAFARLTGLRRVTVGWGETMRADVVRTPGRFDVHVDVDDPDTADPAAGTPKTDLDLDLVVRDLPGEALLEYTPSAETDCPASPCPASPSTVKFTGNGPVGAIDLDVVSGQQLISGGQGNVGAHELHGRVRNVPAGTLDVVVDGENKKMTGSLTAPAPDFVVEVEACSPGQCGTPIETLRLPAGNPATVDGLWLEDLADRYQLFGRISGLTNLTLDWSDQVVLTAEKKPGPFDIVVHETKLFEPNSATPLPYGSRTSVAIRDLPGKVDLTYAKGTKSLTYQGSAPIGSIEAWLGVDPVLVNSPITGQRVANAIAGRATEAHALVTGLPTTITLTTAFAEEGDATEAASATLTATPEPIGSIYVELTSDESLLSAPAVQAVPVMSTDDGVLAWDLDDGDADELEPIEDPYLVVARVTALRSFHFEKSKPDDVHQVMMAEADRDTRRNIWIDVLKPEATKPPRALDGFGPAYRYEYLRMGMDVPPERMKFDALITRLPNDDFRTLRVGTFADADAASMTVETDAGSESLTAYVAPVPAGAAYDQPGVEACVSPSRMDCQPEHRVDYAGSEPVSVSLSVAKPVHIDVVRVERKAVLNGFIFPEFHVHMDVERFMQASKEVDFENCNEYFLFVDTQGHGIQGDITDYTSGGPGGGTDLDIELPPGTMAQKRWIKLEGPPCHSEILGLQVGNNPRGEMSCPSGMDIEIDAFEDIDVHVEDEICPEPRISRVESASGQPMRVTRGVDTGRPVTMHLLGRGFAPVTCSPVFAEWPPCSGPVVRVGRVLNGSFIADSRFTIISRTWHWTNHVEVVVEVAPGVPAGAYAVFVNNPETGTHTCVSQEVDGVDVPCFEVVD